jgi:hypothetical protein
MVRPQDVGEPGMKLIGVELLVVGLRGKDQKPCGVSSQRVCCGEPGQTTCHEDVQIDFAAASTFSPTVQIDDRAHLSLSRRGRRQERHIPEGFGGVFRHSLNFVGMTNGGRPRHRCKSDNGHDYGRHGDTHEGNPGRPATQHASTIEDWLLSMQTSNQFVSDCSPTCSRQADG